ncbi:hypothetical protein UPYG_G00117000 [Umbra pygmaea]|uniref:Uncharacterized protein n=1 Tax=Umbra pygmaea TaxID=75934 RepID=A0ABD0X836_UMBPY
MQQPVSKKCYCELQWELKFISSTVVDEDTGPSSSNSRRSLRMNSQVNLRLLVKAHPQPQGGLKWKSMAS